MNINSSLHIAKKEIEKTIINELCKKKVIHFCQCINIIKRLDEDIMKLESKYEKKEDMINMIVNISI